MNLFTKSLYRLSRAMNRPLAAPELLIISLTQCCNLKCVTCSIKEAIREENVEIDLDKISDILLQAQRMKIRTVVLSGGEPFLIKEIFAVSDYIKKLNMTVCVTTNGFYGDKLIERIAESGISHLHFSLDGLREHNDAIRGEGSYDRLMRTIALLRKFNPAQSIGLGTVILSKNCNDLFELTKIADGLKINTMNFIPYLINNIDPQHSKKGCEHSDLWPGTEDLRALKRNFSRIRDYNFKFVNIDPHPGLKLLFDYYSLGKIRKKCFAGYKSIIITAPRRENGKTASDVFFCQDSCGNIYETGLNEAWVSKKAKQMRLAAKRCGNPCLQFCHYI